MIYKLIAVVVAAALAAACSSGPSSPAESAAGPADPPATSGSAAAPSGHAGSSSDWFRALGHEAGLDFTHFNGMSGQYYFPETLLPGVALFDYDGDGDLDVYLVQGEMLGPGKTVQDASLPPPPGTVLNGRLFRNDLRPNADGMRAPSFTDVTAESGIDARGYGMGAATGDYNNDGCIDLYLTFLHKTQLYRNTCQGRFTDVTAEKPDRFHPLGRVGGIRRLRPRRMARPVRG